MAGLGYGSLLVAWLAALFGAGAGLLAARSRRAEPQAAARRATLAVAGLLSLAMGMLIAAFLARDFSIRYVYSSSSTDLSVPLTVAAVYSGQKGSLLFWSLVLSVLTVATALATRRDLRRQAPLALVTLLTVQLFFLTVLLFISNPFERFPFRPAEGVGLNPLLVDSGMLAHPPLLLSGYASTAVPFALVVAALAAGRMDRPWLVVSRRFALVSWTLLGIGNLVGAWWAYHVLGWGGYWGWDPVENSALLPWLAMTAYLHSVMVQERRGMMKSWNAGLIIAAFLLAMLGTFNVRSGILSSVHSFAASALGPAFLGFFLLALAGGLVLLLWRLPRLRAESELQSLLSREAAFVVAAFLFAALIVVTLVGTFYPLLSEILTGERVTMGSTFFQRVNGPILLGVVALMGVGPLLPWRYGSARRLAGSALLPAGAGAALVAALVAAGLREPLALLAFGVIAFTLVVTVREFAVGARSRQRSTAEPLLLAFGRMVRRDHRRYGGYVVHLGVTLMALAIVASTFFQVERRLTLAPGESARVGRYELTYRGLFSAPPRGNGVERRLLAPLGVRVNGREAGEVVPERRFYRGYQEPSSTISIRSGPIDDLYVVLQAFEERSAVFVVFVNPLVFWLWVGGGVVLLGAWITLWPGRQPRRVAVPVRSPLGAVGDA